MPQHIQFSGRSQFAGNTGTINFGTAALRPSTGGSQQYAYEWSIGTILSGDLDDTNQELMLEGESGQTDGLIFFSFGAEGSITTRWSSDTPLPRVGDILFLSQPREPISCLGQSAGATVSSVRALPAEVTVGMRVYGFGYPPGTTVTAITAPARTAFTTSNPATALDSKGLLRFQSTTPAIVPFVIKKRKRGYSNKEVMTFSADVARYNDLMPEVDMADSTTKKAMSALIDSATYAIVQELGLVHPTAG